VGIFGDNSRGIYRKWGNPKENGEFYSYPWSHNSTIICMEID
jgi:hypothetical protein